MTIYNKKTYKSIELMVCDGDNTLIKDPNSERGSSWDFVGCLYIPRRTWEAEAKQYLTRIREATEPKEQDRIFEEWSEHDAKLLKGFPAAQAICSAIPYNKGVLEYFSKDISVKKAIISGGVDVIMERATDELGFDYCFTNKLGIAKGLFDGTVTINVSLNNKKESLEKALLLAGNSGRGTVLAIGDGTNDIPIFEYIREQGGYAIAICPENDDVKKAANATINDFRELDNYITRQ
jgi:phosphoserine phosphatase